MKNIQIKPYDLVPKEIRIQVYKEAIKRIKTNTHNQLGIGICLVIPCILWGLEFFLDPAPNGDYWTFKITQEMFPEITDEVIDRIKEVDSEKNQNRMRIKVLEEIVKELE